MRRTLELRAPEWFVGIEHELSASPRTFARFVGRPSGTVGGLPRRVGMANYAGMGPSQVLDGIWLVGDSVFPLKARSLLLSAGCALGPTLPARSASSEV